MPYILHQGDPDLKGVALYTRCEDVLLALSELLLLKEIALVDHPGKTLYGFMDVDPSFTIAVFKRAYKNRRSDYKKLMAYRDEIIANGWQYTDVELDKR